MLKPEGFVQQADPFEFLFFAKERGLILEAQVEKVSYPDTLAGPVWEVSFPELPGVTGVVPASESGLDDKALMARFVGQRIFVKVKGLDRENRVAACSRREALADARERVLASLEEGQVVDAVVRAVLPRDPVSGRPARLVLDVGGGLMAEVPRARATRSEVARLGDLFKPGQAVKAKVLAVNRQAGEVRVSVVDAEPDPWGGLVYRRGEVVAGTVVRQAPGVLFVEVRPGVVGIAPPPLKGSLRRGQRVACVVSNFDPARRKLHLRVRGLLA
ncbi:RNA-binding protein S1 [Desulfovirgula thermocuniculi]|uniref:RNA-binding protein S1 n=1 Tax=Desulfovirgula thermocuniculi TaxID=348842 RepID=UPI0003F8B73F|nr:RNA-binding protein S1 [Desulfovirgula thermocuniculi]